MIKIIKETEAHKITKTGKLEQKFVVKSQEGETLAFFKYFTPRGSKVYTAGEYVIDTFDIQPQQNGEFCNFFMRNLTFKKKGK
jgi:hypothetical protein